MYGYHKPREGYVVCVDRDERGKAGKGLVVKETDINYYTRAGGEVKRIQGKRNPYNRIHDYYYYYYY